MMERAVQRLRDNAQRWSDMAAEDEQQGRPGYAATARWGAAEYTRLADRIETTTTQQR